MALVTTPAKCAVVNVVALVTGVTNGSKHLFDGHPMATLATKLAVSTIKQEFRCPVMIERPDRPDACNVAAVAFVTKRSLVRVILQMAAHTGFRRFSVAR